MNRKQIQTNLFKAMLNGSERVIMSEINEDEIAFTYDGYRLFVMDSQQMVVDLSKIRKVDAIGKGLEANENDVEIKLVGAVKLDEKSLKPRILEFKANKGDQELTVLLNADLYSDFKDCTLKAYAPNERVLAYDMFGMLIGSIMPLRDCRQH